MPIFWWDSSYLGVVFAESPQEAKTNGMGPGHCQAALGDPVVRGDSMGIPASPPRGQLALCQQAPCAWTCNSHAPMWAGEEGILPIPEVQCLWERILRVWCWGGSWA